MLVFFSIEVKGVLLLAVWPPRVFGFVLSSVLLSEQMKTNMEMDSHEERLHNMIQDSKREAAKEEAGRRAKELREKQKEAVSREP